MRHLSFLLVSLLLLGSLSACTAAGVAVGAGAGVAVAAQKEKGLQQVVSDAEIRTEINHLWFQKSETIFLNAEMEVQEGKVLLLGNVPTPEDRLEAVRLAWQADGVREVINQIEVGDTSSIGDYARDLWIKAQLESKILLDGEVSSIDYTIDTLNQTIYLMGIARNQTELDRVISHAKDIKHVRHVVSYVRLKDDPPSDS